MYTFDDSTEVEISLYKNLKDMFSFSDIEKVQYINSKNKTDSLVPDQQPAKAIIVVISNDNDELINDLNNNENIDFVSLIKESRYFFNSDVEELKKISNGFRSYSLIDYMYFSTITITTTGYGDILPNSTRVRCLVMIESIIGVILIGLFINSIFDGMNKHSEKKAKPTGDESAIKTNDTSH
jgi:voltage-gated potassium channel Kch